MQSIKKIILTFFCVCLALFSSAQYFNSLFDIDSTGDVGYNVFVNSNGSFQTWCFGANNAGGQYIGAINITANGAQINQKKVLDYGNVSISFGPFENVTKKDEQNYFSPVDIFGYSTVVARQYTISCFAQFNGSGDTVLFKIYTDSSKYQESAIACIQIPAKKYFLAGSRRPNFPLYALDSALLRCLDSNGNELWERSYQKQPGTFASFSTLQLLPDGHILAGAQCLRVAYKSYPPDPNPYQYYLVAPWFLILDTAGNIVRDTIYSDTSVHYMGGRIFNDKNGGYFHTGVLDSFFMSSPNYPQNLPNYIAHLDTNFRFTWVTSFADTAGKRIMYNAKQLQDGGYLVYGTYNGISGWMARLNRQGQVLWDHQYRVDSVNHGYLADAIELSNGHIVATGSNGNKALPAWRGNDVWLLEVDAGGCEVPGCSSNLAVPEAPKVEEVSIYPNPTAGSVTVKVAVSGQLQISDVQGKIMLNTQIVPGIHHLNMPENAPYGMYFVQFASAVGAVQYNARIIYQR